jgi:hypothetical protein
MDFTVEQVITQTIAISSLAISLKTYMYEKNKDKRDFNEKYEDKLKKIEKEHHESFKPIYCLIMNELVAIEKNLITLGRNAEDCVVNLGNLLDKYDKDYGNRYKRVKHKKLSHHLAHSLNDYFENIDFWFNSHNYNYKISDDYYYFTPHTLATFRENKKANVIDKAIFKSHTRILKKDLPFLNTEIKKIFEDFNETFQGIIKYFKDLNLKLNIEKEIINGTENTYSKKVSNLLEKTNIIKHISNQNRVIYSGDKNTINCTITNLFHYAVVFKNFIYIINYYFEIKDYHIFKNDYPI